MRAPKRNARPRETANSRSLGPRAAHGDHAAIRGVVGWNEMREDLVFGGLFTFRHIIRAAFEHFIGNQARVGADLAFQFFSHFRIVA